MEDEKRLEARVEDLEGVFRSQLGSLDEIFTRISNLEDREATMRDIRSRQLHHYAGWAMLGLVQRPHLGAADVASLAVDMAEALIAELEARGQ
jgi:hypothetical protein